MEQSYIQNYGQYNTIIDGNVIENTKWNAVYNENGLDLEAKRNNESIYINLSKDELIKLFEVPASNKSIHERLENDLYSKHEQLLVKPIIIEEINNKIKKNHYSSDQSKKHHTKKHLSKHHTKKHLSKYHTKKHHSKKHHTKKHHTKKHHSKHHSKNHTKNHTKKQHSITPDYLKTIY